MNKIWAHATFHLASKDGSNKLPFSLFSLGIGVGANSLPSLYTSCQIVGILALSQLFSLAPGGEVKGSLYLPLTHVASPPSVGQRSSRELWLPNL